jgi:hypothetical protein
MVAPPTEIGSPAKSTATRAMLSPCSPSGYAHPDITSSIVAGSIFGRATQFLAGVRAKPSGLMETSAPFRANRNGVRT